VWARSVHGFIQALRAGTAATTAAQNGAINVWINDAGEFQGIAMRNQATTASFSTRHLSVMALWLRLHLQEIR